MLGTARMEGPVGEGLGKGLPVVNKPDGFLREKGLGKAAEDIVHGLL